MPTSKKRVEPPPPHAPADSGPWPSRRGEAADPLVGKRLGKFQIVGKLGQGGLGVVYEAHDPLLKRNVALKVLPEAVSKDAELRQRFLLEAQAAAQLSHRNVVAIHEVGEEGGTFYIAMELVRGGSAQDYLDAHGAFPWPSATRVVAQVCRGLIKAHEARMIHRDIKPANIMCSNDGVVKLADFGLVKTSDPGITPLTEVGTVVGTPIYMSPEQCQAGPLTLQTDIYSLGVTYYALLTGKPPYHQGGPMEIMFAHCSAPVPDPRSARPGIPQECVRIVQRAMAKQPSERYATATELLADLKAVLALPVETEEPSSALLTRPASDAREATVHELPAVLTEARAVWARWQLWIGVAGGVLGLLLLAAVLMFDHSRWRRTQPTSLAAAAREQYQTLAAAAEQAIQHRQRDSMQTVLRDLGQLHRTLEQKGGPETADLIGPVSARLERLRKAIAFQGKITAEGHALAAGGQVEAVAISPDGKLLAAAIVTKLSGVRIWDWHTGEELAHLWPQQPIRCLAFGPRNSVLAAGTGGWKGSVVHFWDPATRLEKGACTVGGAGTDVRALALAPDGQTLAVGVSGGKDLNSRLVLLDAAAGKPIRSSPMVNADVFALRYVPDGSLLAVGVDGKAIKLWHFESRAWKPDLMTAENVSALAVDGTTLVATGHRMLQYWDWNEGTRIESRPQDDYVNGVAFSFDRKLLATTNGLAQVTLWDAGSRAELKTLKGHKAAVFGVAFAPDGTLATGSWDESVRLWDVASIRARVK